MRQTWLRTNVRAFVLGAIPPAMVALLAVVVGLGSVEALSAAWIRGLAWLVAVLAGIFALTMIRQATQPRLAYEAGHLLVYLQLGPPVRVPMEIVEAFFLGQGPSMLSGRQGEELTVANLVVRLAEKAEDWKHRDVKPALGHWCDGYITIRGTWCERLSVERVNQLNHQLAETSRSLKQDKSLA